MTGTTKAGVHGSKTLVLLLAIAVVFNILFFSNTLEDAQITFRYALRWSEGFDFGMWNRTGNPVEGFTTFLWMVYLSQFGPNIDSIVTASKITGILAQLSIIGLFFRLHKAYGEGETMALGLFDGQQAQASQAFLYAAIGVSVSLPLTWYASSGMEMLVFVALISYALFLPLLTANLFVLALISVLLVLTRPDGIMFAFAAPLYCWFIGKDKKYLWVAVASIIAFVSLIAFRYSYFGYFMPNSYYAKSANAEGLHHLKYGILYFGSYVVNYLYLFIPMVLAIWGILRKKQWLSHSFLPLAFAGIALYFAIVAKAGGDNFSAFPMWRHGLNLFPLTLFCTFFALRYLGHAKTRQMSQGILALIVVMPLIFTFPTRNGSFLRGEMAEQIAAFPNLSHDYRNNDLMLWLNNISDENTVISTLLAGELPLTVDAYHLDVLGLNTEEVAHTGTFDTNGPIDSKSNMSYILSQSPDIMEGYVNADKVVAHRDVETALKARQKMNFELLLDERFEQNYLMITNAPYPSFNRVLFIHKAYYDKIRHRHDVQVKPVTELVKVAKAMKAAQDG